MAALDFPANPTVGQQYAAPNGVTYQWDGAAWVVTGGVPGVPTGPATGDLSGSYPSPLVAKLSGAAAIPLPGDTTKATLLLGTLTSKAHVTANNAAGQATWVALASNRDPAAATVDDTTKPAWQLTLNSQTDNVVLAHVPAGGAVATLLGLDNAGVLSLPGDGTSASVLLHSATAKGRLQAMSTLTAVTVNRNFVTNTQDDGTRPSWTALMRADTDLFLIQHAPAGSTTQTNVVTLDNAGNFTISGAVGTKASGTTWANPSDRRIKKNIAPYVRGLAAILALKPSTFEFNGLAGSQDGLAGIGLISDDVQPVMPEMVSTTPTKLAPDDAEPVDLLTLDTSPLVLALVNAVQELAARVAALEAHAA